MSRAFADTPQSDVIIDSARLDLITYEPSSQWGFSENFNTDVAYHGTFTTSNFTGDTATFTFNGTQIGVWAYMPRGASAADFGTPTVTRYTIDGSNPITYQSQFLSSRPVTGAHEQVFQSNILSPGIHVLQIHVVQPGKLQYHLDWVEYNGTTSTGTNSNGDSGSNSNPDNNNNGESQNSGNGKGPNSTGSNNNTSPSPTDSNGSNSTGSNNNTAPSPTDSNGSNPQESLPLSSAAKSVPVSTIAGGAAAGVVLIIGIAILAFWIGRTRRRRRRLGATQDEATLFKGPASSDRPYADDDDAPAYLTHQRPAVSQKTNSTKQSSSAYTHSDMSTAYDAPLPIPAYATPSQARPAVAPPMPTHGVPMAAAQPIPPLAAPISDYGSSANVTGSAISSSRSDGSSAGTRYRTAQEEKALVYLSESGISRGPGQSSSGEPGTGSSGRAGSSSNLPATGEAPPPAYVP